MCPSVVPGTVFKLPCCHFYIWLPLKSPSLPLQGPLCQRKEREGIETGYMSYPVRARGLLRNFEGQALGGRGREDTMQGKECWSSRALCRGPREAQTKHINVFEITLGCIYSVLLTTTLLWEWTMGSATLKKSYKSNHKVSLGNKETSRELQNPLCLFEHPLASLVLGSVAFLLSLLKVHLSLSCNSPSEWLSVPWGSFSSLM